MMITPFRAKHLEKLAKLEIECFDRPWSLNMFERELRNPFAHYFVALKEDKVIGYGGMWAVAGEGHITNIAVSPQYRRNGLGRLLLQKLLKKAETLDLDVLMLEVRVSNTAAISLYHSMGFFAVGSRKNYYYGNEDALLMNLTIK
ncbi:MAG: ribosomal protein S18-alanine N-acetyltransferase [Firmicutes bacterium]|nr:ribosomal protein S18-alanine N-acetyltransferase [Bacillota bacterium]